MDLLKDKVALVTGVADQAGFAWHIAKTLKAAGAKVVLSCHPRILSILERYLYAERYGENRQMPFEKGEFKPDGLMVCDVGEDASILNLYDNFSKNFDQLHILVHSVAFSPEIKNSHIATSREGYLTAMSVSSYSLVALSRTFLPLMKQASVMALSYVASQRAVPFYGGGMASAKAALECDARMLAWYLGEGGHRCNIISPGPYASRAAKSIGDVEAMIEKTAQVSPLKRPITPQEVADTALFLASSLSSGITGGVIYVDAGCHAMGVY